MERPVTAKPDDEVADFIYETHIVPARARGDEEITIQVHDVWKALDCIYSLGLIRNVLGSRRFCDACRLSLAPPFPDEILPGSYTFKLQPSKGTPPSARA
jgi:hypothetical protein